jgi:nicotinamide-nucleotide amidase
MRRGSRADGAETALALLLRARASLATVESLTGGRLAALITAVPGASASYLGGFVTYATEVKESLVGVPHELVEQ